MDNHKKLKRPLAEKGISDGQTLSEGSLESLGVFLAQKRVSASDRALGDASSSPETGFRRGGEPRDLCGREPWGFEIVVLDPYPVVSWGVREWLAEDLPGVLVRAAESIQDAISLGGTMGRCVWVVEIVDEKGVADWKQLDGLQAAGGAVVVFSRSCEPEIIHEAIRRGATSYVHKTEWRDSLKSAVIRAADGQLYVSEAATPRFLAQIRSADGQIKAEILLREAGRNLLTEREREVMELLGRAHSTRRIALKLGVSAKTVEAHAANIRGKLHLRSMRELVRTAALWQQVTVEV